MSIYEAIGERDGRRVLSLTNPTTMKPSGELVCASKDDVIAAVKKARAAQPAWAALPIKERAKYMEAAIKVILEMQDEIIETVVGETGKAYNDAFSMEVWAACDSLRYYAKNTEKFLSPQKCKVHGMLGFMKKVKILYQPLGVAGIIVPWNGPFILGINPVVQALMAGNAAIVKGSEVTPYSTKLAEKVFKKAGLPDGLVQVLMGDGATGAALCESGVDKIAFTGSVNTGRKVATVCAQQLISCTLELGGKDAMIVCADANIERAATGAVMGSCMNTGHYCCGTERIYVVEGVYDEFVAKVTEKTAALRQGSGDEEEDVGAVFWDKQMDIIERHIDDAKAKGASITTGGNRADIPGLYFQPTVLTNVNHDMLIMREETFGPIVCVQKVKDEDEAIQMANDSEYGLSGNIWTNDDAKAERLAAVMQTGSVSINDMACTYGVPQAPFGGVKDSGLGRVNGETGVRGYCHTKPIIIDKSGKKDQPGAAYPYSKEKTAGMKKALNFLWGGNKIGYWLS